jgi:hypothetical protein
MLNKPFEMSTRAVLQGQQIQFSGQASAGDNS